MDLQYGELDNNLRVIELAGKLDIAGVNEISVPFAGYCSGEKPLVLVDLSGVGFMTSVGIQMLIANAKSIASRGGKMVLSNPSPGVKNVLEMTGIPALIPMYESFESAQAVLLA